MTIEVLLPDGTIATFPDDMPEDAIAAAVADYCAATEAVETLLAAETPFVATPTAPDAPQGPQNAPGTASDTSVVYGPPMRRLVIEEYRRDDDIDRDELTARRIEELLRRG